MRQPYLRVDSQRDHGLNGGDSPFAERVRLASRQRKGTRMSITLKGSGRDEFVGIASSIRIGFAAVPAILRSWRNRRHAYRLSEMPDYLLSDLGIRRDDVHEALGASWREDPTFKLAVRAARRRRGL